MPFQRLAQLTVEREQIAIAVSEGAFEAHIGIAFNPTDGALRILHFANHLRVKAESIDDTRLCWAGSPVGLPVSLGKQVVAIVRAIAVQSPKIAYGLNLIDSQGSFDAAGNYSPPPSSDGLTCASFVNETFSAALSIKLVDLQTWPLAFVNIEWGAQVIKSLERGRATEGHLALMRANNKGLRLHPFEVAAAAASSISEWPLNYQTAHARANTVRTALNQICPLSLMTRIHRLLKQKLG